GVPQSALAAQGHYQSCGPLGSCGIMPGMPTTGGRPDIGLLPLWDLYWLQTQSAQAAAYAMAQADAAGSIPWHVEQSPGVPVQVNSNQSGFWADDRCSAWNSPCSPMSYSAAENGSGIQPDTAHQPELAYTAYLLTGQHYYLDELAAQAGYSETASSPYYIRTANGTVKSGDLVVGENQQLRASAWSVRELMLAALAEPDGSALQSYFAKATTDNMAYTATLAGNPAKGQLIG
ncbi:MAG TPA: hypothetical protein VIK18_07660, partial [Pirellulales bacterium]